MILTKGEIRAKALELLAIRGVKAWKQNNLAVKGRKFIGIKGLPDILGHHRHTGLFAAVEVKTVGDRIRPEQATFLMELALSGGLALIAKQTKEGTVVLEEFKGD